MHQAFQFTGSFLAILCLLILAIALGGCSAAGGMPATGSLSPTLTFASFSGASASAEDAILARAIAEHERHHP